MSAPGPGRVSPVGQPRLYGNWRAQRGWGIGSLSTTQTVTLFVAVLAPVLAASVAPHAALVLAGVSVVVAGLLVIRVGGTTAADSAHDTHQHGTTEGHLFPEGTSSNVQLVSKLGLKNVVPEKIADVGVWNGYAFLAAWGAVTCTYNGVHVVDIRDVTQPREVAFIQAKEGSYPGEGVQALHIDTPSFNGDGRSNPCQ